MSKTLVALVCILLISAFIYIALVDIPIEQQKVTYELSATDYINDDQK